MLYLFNTGARGGYVDNVLTTMHLPCGSENMYQYTFEGDSYIDESIKSGLLKGNSIKDKDVLIIFVNKEKAPYEYIPLRKGKLMLKEDRNGRSYFYVSLDSHCACKGDYDSFNKSFRKLFADKLFNSPKEGTVDFIDKKQNKGYLAFYGQDIPQLLECNDNSWKKTVKKLSECEKFKNNVIFTKLDIYKKSKALRANFLKSVGKASYTFKKGKTYTAELAYYIPFHDNNTTSYFDIELVSNPDESILRGAALTQRLGIMDGLVKFKFFPTDVCTDEEIFFNLSNCSNKEQKDNIRISKKPFSYKVRKSFGQNALLVSLTAINGILLYYVNYYTALIDSTNNFNELKPRYFIILTVVTIFSTIIINLLTKVFGRKK